jgi:hypothetical protein
MKKLWFATLMSMAFFAVAEPAPATGKALEPFAKELKGNYPGHVDGCSVAQGHIAALSTVKYCPLRTSLCGEGAKCGHPGARTTTVMDIAVDKVIFTNVKGEAKAPVEFKHWTYFGKDGFAAGDPVVFSYYTYNNNVPPMIATLKKADSATATTGTIAYTQGEGYFVKNTHPIPANGISCLWLNDQAAFDAVFQKAPPLMNSKRTDPVSRAGAVAFAIIHQGSAVPEMNMTSVTVADGVATVAYTLTQPKAEGSATFAVPLILVVDQAAIDKAGGAKSVRFVENGKEIGTAQAK